VGRGGTVGWRTAEKNVLGCPEDSSAKTHQLLVSLLSLSFIIMPQDDTSRQVINCGLLKHSSGFDDYGVVRKGLEQWVSYTPYKNIYNSTFLHEHKLTITPMTLIYVLPWNVFRLYFFETFLIEVFVYKD